MNPYCLIRAEANERVGLGHLRRCLSIAEATVEAGCEVELIADDNATVREMAGHAGIPFMPAQGPPGSAADLAALIGEIRRRPPVFCLLDSYKYALEQMAAIRATGSRLAVIDDLADREFACDLLINGAPSAERLHYKGYIADRLLGPKFVPLSRQYRTSSPTSPAAKVGKLVITLGGTDPNSLTELLLTTLENWSATLEIRVVIGPYFENVRSIESVGGRSKHAVSLLVGQDGLFEHIRWADFLISAGGQTVYEIAAIGRPALCLGVSPNQYLNLDSLAQEGALEQLRYHNEHSFQYKLQRSLFGLLGTPERRAELAKNARRIVDGKGSTRIAQTLLQDGKK